MLYFELLFEIIFICNTKFRLDPGDAISMMVLLAPNHHLGSVFVITLHFFFIILGCYLALQLGNHRSNTM
ncbi:hypothetical protein ACOSP7_015956 [Xanthoceras sorbifolium]